jgi:HTH-type transcriptional regulator / antitoxin HigA
MIGTISTEKQYNEALETIETYLQKGSMGMTTEDKQALRQLSLVVEAYEQKIYPMPMQPQSLIGMIQVKMFERRLKQKELAQLLDISETTLSEVMNGKRKINLSLAKQLYKKLGIAPDFILECA